MATRKKTIKKADFAVEAVLVIRFDPQTTLEDIRELRAAASKLGRTTVKLRPGKAAS